jgi:PII interaction protein X
MNTNSETYINHPTFGLLYKICQIEENQELYTTLYAQRLFFVVTFGLEGVIFEPVTRSDARTIVDTRLRHLRRAGLAESYKQINDIYQRTFQ